VARSSLRVHVVTVSAPDERDVYSPAFSTVFIDKVLGGAPKSLKRFSHSTVLVTGLKSGVNEKGPFIHI
jgi:hypothetical protein